MPTASTSGWPTYSAQSDPHARKFIERQRRNAGQAAPPRRAQEQVAQLSWEGHLEVLRRFVAINGHALVPLDCDVSTDGGKVVRLGTWLSSMWAQQNGGYLSAARALRLEEAGVVWDGEPPPATGVIDPRCYNERKWDLVECNHVRRDFDAARPACEPHWPTYSAEADPHTQHWLARQRHVAALPKRPSAASAALKRTADAGFQVGAAVPGLPNALGDKLKAAREALLLEEQAGAARRAKAAGRRATAAIAPKTTTAAFARRTHEAASRGGAPRHFN